MCMASSPEISQETPQIVEHDSNAEFVVDETLQNTGVQTVQKTFKSQVFNDNGQPVIQTPPTKVITVSPPSDSTTLGNQAKGDVSDSSTWLAKFWLRILQKALHFGWSIIGR